MSSCVVSVLFCIFLLAFGIRALFVLWFCFFLCNFAVCFSPPLLSRHCNHRQPLGCFLAVWWGLCCAFTEDGVPRGAHVPVCPVHDVHPGAGGAGRLRRAPHRAGGSALRPREVSGTLGAGTWSSAQLWALLAFARPLSPFTTKGESLAAAEQFL